MIEPGPLNLITDVDGISVGNAEDEAVRTGVTVLLPDAPVTAAVDVRGGAPGTRETDALAPGCLVEAIHGICLSGGSVFGLDAASATVAWLSERGRGLPLGPKAIPVVPAAILFDMANGGNKEWGAVPPHGDLARRACDHAAGEFALGNTGAGYGATAGDLKGGLGSASLVADGGLQIGALMAVNAFGSCVVPGTSTLWAWPFERGVEMGGQEPPTASLKDLDPGAGTKMSAAFSGGNTTIGMVATNAVLDKAQAGRLAIMAHDGLARAIRPAHTSFDGDTLFVVSTGQVPLGGESSAPEAAPAALLHLGSLAADCVARAIGRGIWEAESLGGVPSYRETQASD